MWALIVSALRQIGRELKLCFATLFAFLPGSTQTVLPGTKPFFADVKLFARVITAFLGAVWVVLLVYRAIMVRQGHTPAKGVIDFFPDKPLFYANVLFTLLVFSLSRFP